MDSDIKKEFRAVLSDVSTDIIVQVVDAGIDLLISAPKMIEAIPIAGSMLRAIKGGIAIRDRLFALKVAHFLNQIHDGTITEKEYATYIEKMDSDEEYLKSITKVTIAQLESFNDEVKATVLGELLKAHIKKELTYEEYKFFAYSVNMISPIGLKYLLHLYSDYKIGIEPIIGSLLVGTGLVAYSTGNYAGNDGAAYLTAEGQKICKVVLEKVRNQIDRI